MVTCLHFSLKSLNLKLRANRVMREARRREPRVLPNKIHT